MGLYMILIKKMTIFLMRDPFLLASILVIRYTALITSIKRRTHG